MKPNATSLHKFQRLLSRRVVSPLQGITFREWCRILGDDRIAITPQYWLRAAATGLSSVVNSLQAGLEQRRFGDRIAAAEVHPPVFILGHYRTGTTHLHNLMALDSRLAFPNYYQVNFPRTFLTTEALGSRMGFLAPRKRPFDNVALGLALPAEDELALCADTLLSPHMGWHFPGRALYYRRYLDFLETDPRERKRWQQSLRYLAQKLSFKYGRPLVFKSPCHTARIPLILEVFPNARFVHIHRDPFTVFRSTRHMELKVGPLFQYQPRDLKNLDAHILWRYRRMYASYLTDRGRIPEGHLTEIAYARLTRDPVGTMEGVYRALDLPGFAEVRPVVQRYLERINGYQTNAYGPLPDRVRHRIARAWQPFFEEWKYPIGRKFPVNAKQPDDTPANRPQPA